MLFHLVEGTDDILLPLEVFGWCRNLRRKVSLSAEIPLFCGVDHPCIRVVMFICILM